MFGYNLKYNDYTNSSSDINELLLKEIGNNEKDKDIY